MKAEEVFGTNAGKVWQALKSRGPMAAEKICKTTNLKLHEVFGGLGWLGKEGKIQIVAGQQEPLYKLND